MPNRRTNSAGAAPPARESFRRRYDALETRRAELIGRLSALPDARAHPAHRRATRLLNETFRKGRLTQRLAILQAAAWLIGVLEKLAQTM